MPDQFKSCVMKKVLVSAIVLFQAVSTTVTGQSVIERATLGEANQPSQEVNTEELRQILRNDGFVFDVRPYMEYATSHIPGAVNISAKPGVEMSLYVSDVAEIDRLLEGKKNVPVVLYCNGPYCGKSKRWPRSYSIQVIQMCDVISLVFRYGVPLAG